jgi:hypothetical protein
MVLEDRVGLRIALDSSVSLERDTVRLMPPESARSESASTTSPPDPSNAVELNPLPMIGFGKFGGNIEISLAPQQVLIVSPAYFSYGDYFYGPEAELGYRFYFDQRPLSGPFVGLGVMGAAFLYHPDADCGAGVASCSRADQSTFLYGATVEAGWQWVLRSRILLGLGLGLIMQHAAPRTRRLYQSDFTSIAELTLDSGVRPRGLFTVGIAF